MSHAFVRNLTFQSNDLGKDVSLMLTFDKNMEGSLYRDVFPVVWKVSSFRKTGPYKAHATYTSQLAFSKPQLVDGNIVGAETCVKINDGEKTSLTESNNVFHFSPPQAVTSGVVQAVNNTGDTQDIAVGFMNKGDLIPTPALFFSGVKDGRDVMAEFIPVLRAYITSDYPETAVLPEPVDTPAIWSQNLAALKESTTWTLKRDASGHYSIVQA
ncbi:hypothetical protein DEU56DRAFT_823534 [Suillus clintonianus]|uniref:uncharacterized protein n=1 Tax=Suillus clintonianus TaxID=1904413 RepID=UPI001B881EBF|nr:uncharacterized protein DEU56DRAFT_823534 [Suillus clintonianus]KAG2125970.1 hypothetical protein DEU56DRAFT_823534 [Suillus clintonianus]